MSGTFDGDGRDEIAIGAPNSEVSGLFNSGQVYVLDRASNAAWTAQVAISAGGDFIDFRAQSGEFPWRDVQVDSPAHLRTVSGKYLFNSVGAPSIWASLCVASKYPLENATCSALVSPSGVDGPWQRSSAANTKLIAVADSRVLMAVKILVA